MGAFLYCRCCLPRPPRARVRISSVGTRVLLPCPQPPAGLVVGTFPRRAPRSSLVAGQLLLTRRAKPRSGFLRPKGPTLRHLSSVVKGPSDVCAFFLYKGKTKAIDNHLCSPLVFIYKHQPTHPRPPRRKPRLAPSAAVALGRTKKGTPFFRCASMAVGSNTLAGFTSLIDCVCALCGMG